MGDTEAFAGLVLITAVVCILFDGGMHLGWSRFRRSAAPITVIGVAGSPA